MGIGSIIARALVGGAIQGLKAAARESARVERFHQRRAQLGRVHVLVMQDFAKPLAEKASERMSPKELQKVDELMQRVNDSGQFLLEHANEANQRHLNDYALAIKRVALITMKMCQKYSVYNINSVEYDVRRKMILLNGIDHYSLL